MDTINSVLFSLLFLSIAALYSSVGQAGGTGYIAVMGLAGFHPDVIKPTALMLNILVAAIGTARFAAAGLLTRRSCYPFAVLGAPFSLLGGAMHLPPWLYQPVVGSLLVLAVWPVLRPAQEDHGPSTDPPFLPALAVGAGIGFVSGVTGVGGGIFLAPLVLAFRWTDIKEAAAISATFNLLNSAAALAGAWDMRHGIPAALPWWLLAVGLGGLLGSWLAVRQLPVRTLRYILAVILLAAGLRMIVA
jgi:uncharacterized membrane protein YfcA